VAKSFKAPCLLPGGQRQILHEITRYVNFLHLHLQGHAHFFPDLSLIRANCIIKQLIHFMLKTNLIGSGHLRKGISNGNAAAIRLTATPLILATSLL